MTNPEKDKLWERIQELNNIRVLGSGLSPNEERELKESIDKLTNIIKQMRTNTVW